MEWIADLHVHSHFSRATSRDLDLEHLWLWAQRKGVAVVGTGDFTHPGWFVELEGKLVPAEEGLFALASSTADALQEEVPAACRAPVRFLLSAEISSIYKWQGRTRKVHNLIFAPDLATASSINRALSRLGNLHSDGRPILGLDSRDLLEIVLAASERAVLIPAHIWTPWFSVLGSASGFDSLEDCYRDLCPHIFAVETGLSSDPAMNWRLSALDRFALVSNSDAHSPSKLAREANRFSCELSYDALFGALRHPQRLGFEGTVEFFPEEGKYHFDGHRKCDLLLTPSQTRELGGICPRCGKAVTLGVMYRVEALADRPEGSRPIQAKPYSSLIGLGEVLGEVLGVGATSQKVGRIMELLFGQLGPELRILREIPEETLRRVGEPVLAEAIARVRRGQVQIQGGYDGEYGKIHLLSPEDRKRLSGQTSLFTAVEPRSRRRSSSVKKEKAPSPRIEPSDRGDAPPSEPSRETLATGPAAGSVPCSSSNEAFSFSEDPLIGLSSIQRQAAAHRGSPVVIVAGPGTGKTRTLTRRIAHYVREGTLPENVLAVTFTNKAAQEMRLRLGRLLPAHQCEPLRVYTFHALALSLLNEHRRDSGLPPLQVVGEVERQELVAPLLPDASVRKVTRAVQELSRALVHGQECSALPAYRALLAERSAVDLDALVSEAVTLLQDNLAMLRRWRERCQRVCVDEYQDINQAQYELVRLLCPPGADLCVIGDPDQAIYSFRGADSRYFLQFQSDYPDAARFSLEQSHRSSRVILEGAHRLIRHNPRPEGRTTSDLPGLSKIFVSRTPSAKAEAELIVHCIERFMGGTTLFSLDSGRSDGTKDCVEGAQLSFADFAVLFRLSSQAEVLEEAFSRSGMPFVCSAGKRGNEVLEPILAFMRASLDGGGDNPTIVAHLEGLSPRAGLHLLAQRLCSAQELGKALPQIDQLASLIYGVEPHWTSWAPLVLALSATASEADALSGRHEAVSLLTLHASKGLEFEAVFIAGCEEGLLPHFFPGEDEADRIFEERRLMYVGMTRARRFLVLSHARRRARHGGLRSSGPSRFLAEIPEELLQDIGAELAFSRRRKNQLSLF